VALDEVAAERRAGDERVFEIHQTVATQLLQIRAVECFLEQIEGELFLAPRAHGQTTAIHGHALTHSGLGGELGRGYLQLRAAISHPDPQHATNFLNQTGEHGRDFTAESAQDR
jgi:hypothetical protein